MGKGGLGRVFWVGVLKPGGGRDQSSFEEEGLCPLMGIIRHRLGEMGLREP